MLAYWTLNLLLITFSDKPFLSDKQLLDLIREKQAPAKSMAFVYEGHMRWLGDARQKVEVERFGEEFQGTFFYRGSKTATYDLYVHRTSQVGGVVRKKAALLNERLEVTTGRMDAKHTVELNNISTSYGNVATLDQLASPIFLFPTWLLEFAYDLVEHEVVVEGWDAVDGRNCLRVRADLSTTPSDKGRDSRLYWIDLERSAQVLKVEYYQHGQLIFRNDQIRLQEVVSDDGPHYWLPVNSRAQWFILGDISSQPFYERVNSVVAGSAKLNIELPDSLFTVRRDLVWPSQGKLDATRKVAEAASLIRQFREQPMDVPEVSNATDPVSVRNRINNRLAEADRQSAELQASSPARRSGGWADLVPIGLGMLGVIILAGGVVWRWRTR